MITERGSNVKDPLDVNFDILTLLWASINRQSSEKEMPEMALVLATLVLVSTLVPSSLSQYKIVRHNPFASLTPTLAEYTVDGEDGEVLNLACPGETRIVITAASYQAASNFSNCSLSSPLLQVTWYFPFSSSRL